MAGQAHLFVRVVVLLLVLEIEQSRTKTASLRTRTMADVSLLIYLPPPTFQLPSRIPHPPKDTAIPSRHRTLLLL
jgi:hypothetical protein